jgi:hypothetical protein
MGILIEIEYNFKELQCSINLCGPHPDAFVESHKLIPCILHLEQHVDFKMLKLTCAEGLNHYRTVNKQNKYIATVENVLNTRVFGTEDSPSMRYFPRSLPEGEGQLYVMGDI